MSKLWPNCLIWRMLKVRSKMIDYGYPCESQPNHNLSVSHRHHFHVFVGGQHQHFWRLYVHQAQRNVRVNPGPAMSCSLNTVLFAAQKLREGEKVDVSGRAWLGGEEWGRQALVREQVQEVGWDQGKRKQKQKRWTGLQRKKWQIEGKELGQAGKIMVWHTG